MTSRTVCVGSCQKDMPSNRKSCDTLLAHAARLTGYVPGSVVTSEAFIVQHSEGACSDAIIWDENAATGMFQIMFQIMEFTPDWQTDNQRRIEGAERQ